MTTTVAALFGAFCLLFSAGLGAILGFTLRKFHKRPFRVGLGGAYFGLLVCLIILFPAILGAERSESFWSAMFGVLPGALALIAIMVSGWIRYVPVIGGPLVSYMLASTRMQVSMGRRQLEKFEKFEEKFSRAPI